MEAKKMMEKISVSWLAADGVSFGGYITDVGIYWFQVSTNLSFHF
jgi:hypothetical protein